MSRRVLIQLAHPVLERSRVTRRLVDAVRDLPYVTVNDLYEAYPTLSVDAKREQGLLVANDVIVFQHPFYWYSAPALLKQWQDLVLEHGWAYGTSGTKLRGKVALHAISTGGPASAYREGGYNRFTMRELLRPFEQTAHLCGMRFLAPFVVHGALGLETDEDVQAHGEAYRALLVALGADAVDVEAASAAATVNELMRSPA